MPRPSLLAACLSPLILVAACNMGQPDPSATSSDSSEGESAAPQPVPTADPLAANDPAPGTAPDPAMQDDQPRPVMQLQVVLERLGFAPGVIDGKEGLSTTNALAGWQEAASLPVTGKFDDATRAALAKWSAIPATRVVTIPADFAAGPFAPLPKDPAEQAKLPALGYGSLEEKLAERFHTTPDVLKMLNPNVPSFAAGQQVRVPNVGNDMLDPSQVDNGDWLTTLRSLGVASQQPHAARIVVSKGKGTLKAYDDRDMLIALFTVTTGSSHDPLPLGEWKINGKDFNPKFSYDPSLFWDVPDSKGKHLLPPGPNGPVGVVWIDLTKEHYGIHGTPEPQTIGRAESHGCVRLTNWDAARLAQMVSAGTRVLFEK